MEVRTCTICLPIWIVGIFPEIEAWKIGLIYGTYLQFRYLKWPLITCCLQPGRSPPLIFNRDQLRQPPCEQYIEWVPIIMKGSEHAPNEQGFLAAVVIKRKQLSANACFHIQSPTCLYKMTILNNLLGTTTDQPLYSTPYNHWNSGCTPPVTQEGNLLPATPDHPRSIRQQPIPCHPCREHFASPFFFSTMEHQWQSTIPIYPIPFLAPVQSGSPFESDGLPLGHIKNGWFQHIKDIPIMFNGQNMLKHLKTPKATPRTRWWSSQL